MIKLRSAEEGRMGIKKMRPGSRPEVFSRTIFAADASVASSVAAGAVASVIGGVASRTRCKSQQPPHYEPHSAAPKHPELRELPAMPAPDSPPDRQLRLFLTPIF